MTIEIPRDILSSLFASKDIAPGMARTVPGDATLELKALPIANRRGIHDLSPSIPTEVTLIRDAGLKTFVDWLYVQFLLFRHRRLVINGRWVEAQPNDILEAIIHGRVEPGSL